MKRTIVLAVATAIAIAAVGCASDDSGASDEVVGVVAEVTGDLTHVESFVVLDDAGNSHLLTPAEGLLFYGGPLSHLRDHIVSGERVRVTFEEGAYGAMTATLIVHADGDTPHETGDTDHDDDHDHDSDDDMDEMTTTTTG
jgi:hypothetical protein